MIYIIRKKTITKILVKNECSKEDAEQLLELIKQEKELEISFIDTKTLPANIIKVLSTYQKKLKLSTDDKFLWIYLRKFLINISLKYITSQLAEKNIYIKAIAIGGSAGSLGNMIKILKELPFVDISIFIVMHILPDKENSLVSTLQQCTKYTVKEAKHGEKIKPYHIYVASANMHMVVESGYIYQLKTQKVNFCRPSIDILFKTLALEYKKSLLAILTCGYMDDGSRSLKDIKKSGGISLIQNPNECEANEIPLNAIITKNYTHVLGIKEIINHIKLKLNTAVSLSENIDNLIHNIRTIYGYDFRNYDKKSVTRRIKILQQELGIKSFKEFVNLILINKNMFELLFKNLSINVSEFFRNPLVFKQIREKLVPILETYPHIRIWCSACSEGQEPYSIAMILDEVGLLERSIIYATDFNSTILEQAKNGIYPKDVYKEFKKNYIKSGGIIDFEKWWQISENYIEIVPYIKDKIHFFQHNLVTDGEINEFNIIFCRNVLIYFDEKLQEKVFKLLYGSLIRDGFLILGESELVREKDGFKRFDIFSKNKIYKKIEKYK